MGPKQAMNDYKVNFIMTDGSQLLGHKELEKYLVSKDNEVTGVAV